MMENNVLNWFRENVDNKSLEDSLLDARKKDIINVLKILNDNYPISDGGQCWLERDEDFERTADEIINFEKNYKENKVEENNNDNVPCENWNGTNHKGWACKIYCKHPNECDGITCKKNCDWYNKTNYFSVKSVKKRKKK